VEFTDDVIRVAGGKLTAGAASYRLRDITSVRVALVRENANEKVIAGFALFVGFDVTACGVVSGADGMRSAGFACLAVGALAAFWAGKLSPKRYLLIVGVSGTETVLAKYGDPTAADDARAAIEETLGDA
jgi:hypothetical protein